MNESLDPRVKRLGINNNVYSLSENECWTTFEVFHQKKTGAHHTHVGSVHAPNQEMALIFAKEQFGRRLACVSLWVVKSSDVFSTRHEDADLFSNATSIEKKYRDAGGFKVREKINAFKKRHQ